jgi:CheY-like chemotaxis protein
MAKILVVDREEVIRALTSQELEELGYEVITYDRSYGVLDLIRDQRPDVVITNIRLESDKAGLRLLSDIRQNFPSLPLIIHTAYTSFKGEIETIPADYFVTQSADLTELKNRVNQCLGKYVSDTDKLNHEIVLRKIKGVLSKVMNMYTEPPAGFSDLAGHDSIISDFKSKAYFSYISTTQLHAVYQQLRAAFLKEIELVREHIGTIFHVGSFMYDPSKRESFEKDGLQVEYYKLESMFEVISHPRFLYEYKLVSGLLTDIYQKLPTSSNSYLDTNRIVRSLEFPPELKSAVVSILGYFNDILNKKYPEIDVGVSIEQKQETITLIISTPEGKKEIIEKELNDYKSVILGDMKPEDFITDRYEVILLRNKLEIAALEVRQTRQLLESEREHFGHRISQLEDHTKLLSKMLDKEENQKEQLISCIKDLSTKSGGQINAALQSIIEILKVGISENNKDDFINELNKVRNGDKNIFDKLNEILIKGALQGAAGNYLYSFLQTLSNMG